MDRLQEIEDRLAILALQVDYARAADSFDGNLYASVFTEDAVLDASHCGFPVARGRREIAAVMDDAFRQQTHNIHLTTNQRVLTIDGDRAAGFAYFFSAASSGMAGAPNSPDAMTTIIAGPPRAGRSSGAC
jgi:uncharacterized protein (TIGR02246 family)